MVEEAERACEATDESLGAHAALALLSHRDAAMSLGEALAVGTEHERQVRVPRSAAAERLDQRELARCRREEVVASHHVADLHREVVDHDGELVAVHAVGAAHHEVASTETGRDGTVHAVGKAARISAAEAEAQRRRPFGVRGAVATGARVDRLLAMRRARETVDLLA